MKTLHSLLALALLVAPATLAAQSFEGVMKQQATTVLPQNVKTLLGDDVTDAAKALDALRGKLKGADSALVMTHALTVTVKGSRMRVDGVAAGAGPGAGAYMIMDAGKGMTYTVMPGQKQIMFVSEADMAGMQKLMRQRMGLPESAPVTPTVTELGSHVTDGVQLKGYRLTTPEAVAEVWVDPALSGILAPFEKMQDNMPGSSQGAAIQAAMRARGFARSTDLLMEAPPMLGTGWIFNRAEVLSVHRQPVKDDVFALPADYKQVNVAQMMGAAR